MRAFQKIGDIASLSLDGVLRTGRIAAINARDAALVLTDGRTVTCRRAALKSVRPKRTAAQSIHHATRRGPGLDWSRGPGKRRVGWSRA